MVEDASLSQMYEGTEKRHFLEPLIVLAKHKRFMILTTGGAAIFSVVLSLLLPVYYTANTKILPPQQSGSMATAMMEQLGGIGSLVGALGGKDLGLRNANDMYVAMLKSQRVADKMIDRFKLMDADHYHVKLREDAYKKLGALTEITARKEGIISISVDDRNPQNAADMANAFVEELEKLTQHLAVTDAGKRQIFFEREARTANDELATAEQGLKQTQEKYGMIQLEGQAKVLLESEARLRAEVASQEVQLQSMRFFATPENPDLKRAEQQLAALKTQLAIVERGQGSDSTADALMRMPVAGLEYVRKLREVKYREKLLELMLRQYEAARIDHGKEAALIQVLDAAKTPERKSSPKRAIICITITMVVFVMACAWVFFREFIERAKEDPQYLARLQLLKFYLSWRRKSADLRT